MFNSNGFPRIATKPQLADAIAKTMQVGHTSTYSNCKMPRYRWWTIAPAPGMATGDTYEEIIIKYVNNARRYTKPIVVFDG